jgi:hypothetical protein
MDEVGEDHLLHLDGLAGDGGVAIDVPIEAPGGDEIEDPLASAVSIQAPWARTATGRSSRSGT